jgi:hypothetical protein
VLYQLSYVGGACPTVAPLLTGTRPRDYDSVVKQIWTSAPARVISKYGENAPAAAVCCNACRTCATTNLIELGIAAAGGAWYAVSGYASQLLKRRA